MGDDDGNYCSIDSLDLDDLQNQLGQRGKKPKHLRPNKQDLAHRVVVLIC